MSESLKTYRIKANPGQDGNITFPLDQDYNVFEILSLKLDDVNDFRLHSSNYGIIVGRVIANKGFGVPNAKVSIFIEADDSTLADPVMAELYPFASALDRGKDGNKYNLLPDYKVDDCHQAVGSIPSKQYILDNDVILEIFDKYYKFTTRTNDSGDYCLSGIPVGRHNIHMDVDLSDCGMLSQRPRDFVYKGYTIEQFENPNQFKKDDELDKLSQVFTQTKVIDVIPFWGNESVSSQIGITRTDFELSFRFEPTCVFMGCIIGDNKSNGISKKCIPTENMGAMDELISGEGTIEMIRKKPDGSVEEFQIKGNELINANGVWCYQIPMNLDYMVTDEYGNMVPSDEPMKGLPTRARVRFRFSMHDFENTNDFYFRSKILVPNNPDVESSKDGKEEELDYDFGTNTSERSFRDLYWDNVYTVKSYIPRFQKHKNHKNERFTGIKHCNIYGSNNPIPYNNIRIRLPLMYTMLCGIIKAYITVVGFINLVVSLIGNFAFDVVDAKIFGKYIFPKAVAKMKTWKLTILRGDLCPDLDGWYFSPVSKDAGLWVHNGWDLLRQTYNAIIKEDFNDPKSIDSKNSDKTETPAVCLTTKVDYLLSCVEMNLAQEYKVINFDFYNDWLNGVLYFPRWMREVRKKRTFLFGLIKVKEKVRGCLNDPKIFGRTRYYTQQCALAYGKDDNGLYSNIKTNFGCNKTSKQLTCHKKSGLQRYPIFGKNGGIVNEKKNMLGQNVYYLKPCEFTTSKKKVNLFATDIILLGSLKECNPYGLPQAYKSLGSSSFKIPTNLALTNMEDSGYLYMTNKGTICSGQSFNRDEAVSSNEDDLSFSKTSDIKRTSDEPVDFSGLDDVIPLTEVAGISWNYSGPGQGKNNYTERYFPGGHFLGLSCTKAETSIKSCVNLQRICEQGVDMSQRHERPRGYNAETGETMYYYEVPTGLITDEEISGESFRSAFASMNARKLYSVDKDPDNDCLRYEYIYRNAGGFNGSFKEFLTTPYNTRVSESDIKDEISNNNPLGLTKGDDYDSNEKVTTFRRSVEAYNKDYYFFRLGYKDGVSNYKAEEKFLDSVGSDKILPQYENSFYFYFGIKDGATAIDEFHKQFFSICQAPDPKKKNPQCYVGKGGINYCDMTEDVTCTFTDLLTPITAKLDPKPSHIPELDGTKLQFHFAGLPFGNYTISAKDANDIFIEKKFVVGVDGIILDLESETFKKSMEFELGSETKQDLCNVLGTGKEDDARYSYGGYLSSTGKLIWSTDEYPLDRTVIQNIFDTSDSNNLVMEDVGKFSIIITDGQYFVCNFNEPGGIEKFLPRDPNNPGESLKISNELVIPGAKSGRSIITSKNSIGSNGEYCVHLWLPKKKYSILIGVRGKCNGGRLSDEYKYFVYNEMTVGGVESFTLYRGTEYLPYKGVLEYEKEWETENSYPLETFDAHSFFKSGSSIFGQREADRNLAIWALKHFKVFSDLNYNATAQSSVIITNNDTNFITTIFGTPEKQDTITQMKLDLNGEPDMCSSDFPISYRGYDLADDSYNFPIKWPRAKSYNIAIDYNNRYRKGVSDTQINSYYPLVKKEYGKIGYLPKNISTGFDCGDMDKIKYSWKEVIDKNGVARKVGEATIKVLDKSKKGWERLSALPDGYMVSLAIGEYNPVSLKILEKKKEQGSIFNKYDTIKLTLEDLSGAIYDIPEDDRLKGAKLYIPYYYYDIYAPMYTEGKIVDFGDSYGLSIPGYIESSNYDNIMYMVNNVETYGGATLYEIGLHNPIPFKSTSTCEKLDDPYYFMVGDENEQLKNVLEVSSRASDNTDRQGPFFAKETDLGFYRFGNEVLPEEAYNLDISNFDGFIKLSGYLSNGLYSGNFLHNQKRIELHLNEEMPLDVLTDEKFTNLSSEIYRQTNTIVSEGNFLNIFMRGKKGYYPLYGPEEPADGYKYFRVSKTDSEFKYPFADSEPSEVKSAYSMKQHTDGESWVSFRWENYQNDGAVRIMVPIYTNSGMTVVGFDSEINNGTYLLYAYERGNEFPFLTKTFDADYYWVDEIPKVIRERYGDQFSYVYESSLIQYSIQDKKPFNVSDVFKNSENILSKLESRCAEIKIDPKTRKSNVELTKEYYVIGVELPNEENSESLSDFQRIRVYPNPSYETNLINPDK